MIGRTHEQIVLNLVRTAARQETEARGSGRRAAFRTTRYLLAGAIAAGVSNAALAAELGVKTSTVSSRAGRAGPITAVEFAALTGSPIDRIRSWNLAPWSDDDPGMHSATLLLTALLSETDPTPTRASDAAAWPGP